MILGRLLRVALRTAIGRAWVQRSRGWLAVVAGLAVVRWIERRGKRPAKASSSGS